MEELESETYTPMPVSLMEPARNNLNDRIAQHGIVTVQNNILVILFKTLVFYDCTGRVEKCMQLLA